MKILAVLTLIASSVLSGCGGGDASPIAPPKIPEVGVTTLNKDYLESVGQYAAGYYGIPRDSFYLYYDNISRANYPASYAGIPDGWYIYGLSWRNFAIVHSGLVSDRWQVAVTSSHEICHVAQRAQGYDLSWYNEKGSYVDYWDRWYEAECKYMGEYLAIGYYIQNNQNPPINEPDGYWYSQMVKYPRPSLSAYKVDAGTENDAMDVIVGTKPYP